MRIQHNIMAMNSYRYLNTNNNALSNNLEKLSSGYRINRAGDDAAGLAISEKMRAQITGLNAAQKNVDDGISLVKTAEGAMQEIQDMLNRMEYLATQSANGTYDNEVDRANLQKEVDALKTEIDRIADSANFNGINLMDGSLAAEKVSAESLNSNTEVQEMLVEVTGGTKSVEEAAGITTSFTIADVKASKADAFQITFTNAEGKEKTLTLAEASKGDLTTTANKDGTTLVNALKAGTLKVSSSTGNAEEDLKELLDLFDIEAKNAATANATYENEIIFKAKDPTQQGVKVSALRQATGADAGAAITAVASAAVSASSKLYAADAHDTDWTKVTITQATGGSKASIKVGDKTYTTSDDATTAASAATKAEDLMKQLKADGYNVKIDERDSTGKTILFSDGKQLQEVQKGTEIVNTMTDKYNVDAVKSEKGKLEFTTGAATKDVVNTLTLTYQNDAGETVEKTIEYTDANAVPNATTTGNAIKAAIEADAELKELFDVTNTNGAIKIESKGSGTGTAYITGMRSSEQMTNVKITDPKDVGKQLTIDSKETIVSGDQITIDGKTYQFVDDMGKAVGEGITKVNIGDGTNSDALKNLHAQLKKDGVEATLVMNGTTKTQADGIRFADPTTQVKGEVEVGGGLQLQIGDTSDDFNQMTVTIDNMHVDSLGSHDEEGKLTSSIADINIGDQKGAKAAITVIKDAINQVSSTRGDLGAIQNRLEHTNNNLAVMEENITDAESAIRDTDVADEMMKYTKNNILIQSAQAMLAQANQVPQGVLQLMQ